MPFPPMPGPPSSPVIPWPIIIRVKDCLGGAFISGAKIFGVNETDDGYDTPSRLSQADGSIIIDCANMSDWKTTDDDLIHIEIMKGYRNAVIFEEISTVTRGTRFAVYPLSAELREESSERVGIVGSAVVGRRIIGRNKS